MFEPIDLDKYKGHTPGPWTDGEEFDHSKQKNTYRIGYVDYSDIEALDGKKIVECDSGVYGPYGADRALIIDAPLLLDALREAYAEIDRLENENNDLQMKYDDLKDRFKGE